MSSNQKQHWSAEELETLKTLYLQKLTHEKIGKAMGRSRASVQRTIERQRQAGHFPDTPRTIASTQNGTSFWQKARQQAEANMLDQVNAIGGFPVRRNITVRGQTFAVWTKRDTNELHPLYRAKAFGAAQAAA